MKSEFQSLLSDFKAYLKYERSLSSNTVSSYLSDIEKLFSYFEKSGISEIENVTGDDLVKFVESLAADDISKRSQARSISSIKALYRFLEGENRIKENPCSRIDAPKMQRYLPSVLSPEEVVAIIDSVDLSKSEGHRNKAILEMLYSCGLRVSELVNLKISDLFFNQGFIRVMGKGSKQRLVPVGEPAIKAVCLYMEIRNSREIANGFDDILFLNRRGKKLTREMIFIIVQQQAEIAGIQKEISPHTFRHSFASHLVENGADLRVVQQMLGHESILTTEIYTHIDTAKWQREILQYHPERKNRHS
ncbi:MAG: site-specific tyrosine recombinase XerD [Bacteroidales bacterium]|nr:site-specific tyrosine recombinase XerD [Bacteroidales bacterium]